MQKIKMSLAEYLEKNFSPDSRPALATLQKRCARGYYENAVKEGRFWYFEVEVSTGDERADRILERLNHARGM